MTASPPNPPTAPSATEPYDLIDWPHYRWTFTLNADQWAGFDASIPLDWRRVRFVAEDTGLVPQSGGVYFFAIEPGIASFAACHPAYAGKAEPSRGLRRRFREYLDKAEHGTESRPKLSHLFRWWRSHLYFYYAQPPDPWIPAVVESALLDAFVPPFNSRFRGRVQRAVNAFT